MVTKHVRNILQDRELDEKSVCAKFAHTADDGKVYQVQFYNLDVILSVGYRANSARAIEFRRWATDTLHSYIVDGCVIDKKRVARNYERFMDAVRDIQKLLSAGSVMSVSAAMRPTLASRLHCLTIGTSYYKCL
ncbi:MAG: RhuM family protein [Patescibacteria group bacterium]